ncbi:MAG: hypothetical protein K8S25_05400 [Alphaproteobacteria bacterium]|nr:hypothetical protein [Alphaproteobacteria bacterium]
MGDLIAGLVALLVGLLLIPVVILVVLLSMAAIGVGIAFSLAAALIGIALHLFFWALPFILVFGLIWLVFRPSPRRQIARQ